MGKDLKGKELGVGLTQRKNGLYQARFVDKFGKRQTIYNRKLRDLQKEMAKAIAESEVYRGVREDVTLDEWYEVWFETYAKRNLKPSSLYVHGNTYKRRIKGTFGHMKLEQITRIQVQSWVNEMLDEGLSVKYVRSVIQLLHNVLRWAESGGYLTSNPVHDIMYGKGESRAKSFLTQEQQKVFVEYATPEWFHDFAVVALNTGLRFGELTALKSKCVDLKNDVLYVNEGVITYKGSDGSIIHQIDVPKTKNSVRAVPVNRACHEVLEKLVDGKQEDELLFLSKHGEVLNWSTVNYHIRKVREAILREADPEFPKVSCHTFRRSFATTCIERGISPKAIQQFLGHARIDMTLNVYTHLTDDFLRSEMKKLDGV